MSRKFSTIPAAVEAIGRGEVIIVVDDEDRENEGDYICAAELVTPETVNFLMSGRGDFCMPVLPEIANRLDLHPLCEENNTKLGTAFLTPLDHVTAQTGITAEERALCVKSIVDPQTRPDDFSRPGHV
ncbi:MAG: 3,4-dihydroxy-2-butanone-4-phosphate synthase, partial [Planctomycetota bacterium]|nr:3,4-dihydroxy-2-butanone-4-phosphate synthase [Planctomycetota bacterium]